MTSRLKIDRVLLATDFSPASEAALRYAAAFAGHFNARLYLLHVLPAGGKPPARAEAEVTDEVRCLRQELAGNCDYMVAVLAGDPVARILQKAREVGADLIVLGMHDPSAAGALPHHVARQVCETSHCPVTCVPCRPR